MLENVSDEERQLIDQEIFNHHKIAAIKIYREATGADLKAAKETIEAYMEELGRTSRDKFKERPPGAGCLVLILLVLTLAGLWF